ncbi:MAG: hypothetical protein HY774_22670 [Acidobacteria bacterium]|nr:hypothetical protein [Acidobacteriota bacterium]
MIHHISISAKNTRKVADILAEVIGGQVAPAPPEFPSDSWFVLARDEYGSFIEVMPYGTELQPGDGIPTFIQTQPGSPYSASHALISVTAPCNHIVQIGEREGWKTERCHRGPFELIEFWVENRILIEFTTPEMTAQYIEFLTNTSL